MLQRTHYTFDYDDYPHGRMRLFTVLDKIKYKWPTFCCTVYAIPTMMKRSDWRHLEKRQEWVHVAPHGFVHAKRECRLTELYTPYITLLDKLAKDARWTKLFKPPWNGFTAEFMEILAERNFAVAGKTLYGVPYPAPAHWRMWSIQDALWASGKNGAKGPEGCHVESHPIYIHPLARLKASKTELSKRNLVRWQEVWNADSKWVFAEECIRSMQLKVNIGCGPQVWDDWACLDPRSYLDPRIIEWSWPGVLPWGDNKADIVFVSHVFEYIANEDYREFLLEMWRVMRPGAVLRISDLATESGYVWRMPGRPSRGTGEVKSLPTKHKIVWCAKRVGFAVYDSEPGVTLSPHKDVLRGDTRAGRYRRGQKFYIECVKDIDIPDVSRAKHYDPRMRRNGTYQLLSRREVRGK